MTLPANENRRRSGVQSQGTAPTPYLNRLADTLRARPAKPVTDSRAFKKVLGIKVKGRTAGRCAGHAVEHWLSNNLKPGALDHTLSPLVLDTGDVLVMTQPYRHPDAEDLAKIENLGGYIVQPDEGWGFLHIVCDPDVYLVPAAAIENFRELWDSLWT